MTVPSAVESVLHNCPSFNVKDGGGLKLLGVVPTSLIMSATRPSMESMIKDYNVKDVFFVSLNKHVNAMSIPEEWVQIHAGIAKPQKYGNGLSNVKKLEHVAVLIFVSRYLGWMDYLKVPGKCDLKDHEELRKGLFFLNKAMDDAKVLQKVKVDESKRVGRPVKTKGGDGDSFKARGKHEGNVKSEFVDKESRQSAVGSGFMLAEIQSARNYITGFLDDLETKVLDIEGFVEESANKMAKEIAITTLAKLME